MLDLFHPATRAWFEAAFEAPTDVQARGWPSIARGADVLLLAPTGSGKTLAAFLWAIDRLGALPEDARPGVRTLYVSPLKALVYDVERNLRAPLVGIGQAAARGGHPFRPPQVAMRTGDTPSRERRRLLRDPAGILVTTPESLYLLLGSQARETLRTVQTVIVDEVHALAGTKRGAHLALSLARLSALAESPPQRIGLSATVRPIESVAAYLGGGRPVEIVDASAPPKLDLEIVVPVRDLDRPQAPAEARGGSLLAARREQRRQDHGADAMGYGAFQQPTPPRGIWPAIQPVLLELIQAHRSTIVFVNSRSLCERLARVLNEMAEAPDGAAQGGAPLVRAHHGSVSHAQRKEIEEALKAGLLRGIVATSSLELGIDMGAVDLVVQVESPRSTAAGLQRVGRAGHGVGQVSRGRIFPKFRGDLLEAAVVARRMLAGELEPLQIPRNPLDVLAQHIVSMVALDPWKVDDLFDLVRRAHNFRDLSRPALVAVLDMLAGRYPSTDFADLRPRIQWDRDADLLTGRQGAQAVALQNAGTIPDRGLFSVHLGPQGPRIGELDEELVHETRVGETLVLGASTWRVEDITRDRVIVSPAPGEPGRMPFWKGEGPGRPVELGRAVGELLREVGARDAPAARAWLAAHAPLDERAVENLVAYIHEQRDATGTLPTDRAITVERFRDELGDWRLCILTPFGARVHAPWALALEARLAGHAGFVVQTMWSDDGIVLRLADAGDGDAEPPDLDALLPDPDEVQDLVVEQLGESALFASVFRENAGRALLLPRRRAGARTPLWAQRLRARDLLAAARQYPAFPVVLETYRSCLQDHFDLPALVDILRGIRRRDIRVDAVETRSASPFARSLVYRYVAQYMYEGDSPAAERRAQALTLDRELLRDLLGQEELRELLDAGALATLEAELQCLVPARHARTADGLHDLLRRLGDLSPAEITERCDGDAAAWLATLEGERRVARVRVAGEARFIAAEDCGRYRDALGVVPPPGIPAAFLEPVERPLRELLRRYARTHGPFGAAAPARRFGVPVDEVSGVLRALVVSEDLLEGAFRPDGRGVELCDPEVLRTLRRRTLAKLRGEVAPVEAPVLARFLVEWQGVGGPGSPRDPHERLLEVIAQLEGLPLPYSELERRILPARVPGFEPRMLDELGAAGEIVWIGHGALGPKDGRVALYRRARLALLHRVPDAAAPDAPIHGAILDHLARAGASFLVELSMAADARGARASGTDLHEALWDLVWAGLITNDTFSALRSLARRAGKKPASQAAPRQAGRRRFADAGTGGGRWSRVDRLIFTTPSDTERAHALALQLLERYGVTSREAARAEGLEGGFGAVYDVLRAMEEAGRVRRGWFVDGLQGAQFAFPGAVDRLRGVRETGETPLAVVLPTIDPANPYGALLPWPATSGDDGGPRRVAGASVVLVDGEPVLYLSAGGKRLLTFRPAAEPRLLAPAIAAAKTIARQARGRSITVERIDGHPAAGAELAEAFLRHGFVSDYRGLTLEAG